MASLEGLKTWFEYEILITTMLIAAAVFFWGIDRFVSFVEIPSLTPTLVLYLVGISLVVLVVLLWESGR